MSPRIEAISRQLARQHLTGRRPSRSDNTTATLDCDFRKLPAEIITKIFILATRFQRRMPALVKALRPSRANTDLYSEAIYQFYTLNTMNLTQDNLYALKYATAKGVEPVRKLWIAFDAVITRGMTDQYMVFEDDRSWIVRQPRPDNVTIQPFPKWSAMEKFSGLRTLHFDMSRYPVQKLFMVHDLFKNTRFNARQLSRLSMDVRLPVKLPMTCIWEIFNDIRIPDVLKLETIWEVVATTYFLNQTPSKLDAYSRKGQFHGRSYKEIVGKHIHPIVRDLPDVLGGGFDLAVVMVVVHDIDERFAVHVGAQSDFIASINRLCDSEGKMMGVGTGQAARFFWELQPPKTEKPVVVGLMSKQRP